MIFFIKRNNKNNIYKEYPDKLSNISDIEKLKRKLNLGILHPYEMAEFISSFDCIKNLLEDISKLELNNFKIVLTISRVSCGSSLEKLKA